MKIDDETIMKIGQIPSIYDLNENINNKNFLKVLGKEYANYYKSACSLYSFSTYIGALIYLRRIFEKLLIDTFDENKSQITLTFDEFKKQRMEDKIGILKPYLPSIMFEAMLTAACSKFGSSSPLRDLFLCSLDLQMNADILRTIPFPQFLRTE